MSLSLWYSIYEWKGFFMKRNEYLLSLGAILSFNQQKILSQVIKNNAVVSSKEFLDPDADAEDLANRLYEYAQYVIGKSDRNEFVDYPEFKLSIRCVDIFKLNHWDSNAKRTSLKWTQFSMDWENVEEMPHPHYERIVDRETLDMVVKYCINDVRSTKAIFTMTDSKGNKVMVSQINLRAKLSETYNVNLLSASEPKISKEIFLHFLRN